MKQTFAALIAVFTLASFALAGSLTPAATPASTMNSLSDLYAGIAGSFDSSSVTASQNGSLIQNLKFIESHLKSAASNSLDFDELVNNMTLDANLTVASAGFSFDILRTNFETSGTASISNTVFVQKNRGNIGIGTTSPTSKLTISLGDTDLASASAAYRINGSRVLWNRGTNNIFAGTGAGASNSTGFENTYVGATAGARATTGSDNTFVGSPVAHLQPLTGSNNVAVGSNAGDSITTGSRNILFGRQGGTNVLNGNDNIALSDFNGLVGTASSSRNICIGPVRPCEALTTGTDLIAIGFAAGRNDVVGGRDIHIGFQAGNVATKDRNVFIGELAGDVNTASHSVFFGNDAGDNATFSGVANTGGTNVFIGSIVDGTVATVKGSIGIGYGARLTANKQGVFGSALASGSLTDIYFGQGVATVSAGGITLHATGGSTSNNAGSPLLIAGGAGTGTAPGGSISFQTAPAGISGSSLNTLVTRMTIGSRGTIGIGTVTPKSLFGITDTGAGSAASGSFAILSANTLGTVASISATALTTGDVFTITVPTSLSAGGARYLLIKDTAGVVYASLGNGGRLTLARDIRTDGSASNCTGANTPSQGCIDYAESYPTMDVTVSAGEIVSLDAAGSARVARATSGTPVLGIVSTNPGLLLTGQGVLSGSNTRREAPANTVAVALAGRVPVKITGHVSAGDHLVLSDVPGVAATATKAGMTIGIALENSDGPTVMAFVNGGWWAPEVPAGNTQPLSGLALLADKIISVVQDAVLAFTQSVSAGKITTDKVCVQGVCLDEAQLKQLLASQ